MARSEVSGIGALPPRPVLPRQVRSEPRRAAPAMSPDSRWPVSAGLGPGREWLAGKELSTFVGRARAVLPRCPSGRSSPHQAGRLTVPSLPAGILGNSVSFVATRVNFRREPGLTCYTSKKETSPHPGEGCGTAWAGPDPFGSRPQLPPAP